PNTFLPPRNLFFLSFPPPLAYQIHPKHIITPLSQTHFSPYPHSTHTFIKSINLTLTLSIHKHFLIHTPLISLHKPHTSPLTHNLPL
ncbi:7-cyano-7-deazaguanine synthase, partial [Staphylococcus epidermidis]|uniref:7-cyano-7-deazaguanine synthase n=1 Tax=Staphylococcus epidermidis TaxID=1282 RepID=UPI00164234EC